MFNAVVFEILDWFAKFIHDIGDEFVVAGRVEEPMEDEKIFKKFALKLQGEFEDIDIPITCSMGLVFKKKTDTVKDLVYKADIKMYESKQKGKNQLTYKK